MVAEINRDPGDERDPKEQIDVRPKNDRIDPGHEVNEMMMIDPVDGDDDEAQDIGKKGWPHFRQGSWGRIMRRLQLQNHDGNENSDNAIAERFDPVRFHASECNTGGPEIREQEERLNTERRTRDREQRTEDSGQNESESG